MFPFYTLFYTPFTILCLSFIFYSLAFGFQVLSGSIKW